MCKVLNWTATQGPKRAGHEDWEPAGIEVDYMGLLRIARKRSVLVIELRESEVRYLEKQLDHMRIRASGREVTT